MLTFMGECCLPISGWSTFEPLHLSPQVQRGLCSNTLWRRPYWNLSLSKICCKCRVHSLLLSSCTALYVFVIWNFVHLTFHAAIFVSMPHKEYWRVTKKYSRVAFVQRTNCFFADGKCGMRIMCTQSCTVYRWKCIFCCILPPRIFSEWSLQHGFSAWTHQRGLISKLWQETSRLLPTWTFCCTLVKDWWDDNIILWTPTYSKQFHSSHQSDCLFWTNPLLVLFVCSWYWRQRQCECRGFPSLKEACLETLRGSMKCVSVPAASCSCPKLGSPLPAARARNANYSMCMLYICWYAYTIYTV